MFPRIGILYQLLFKKGMDLNKELIYTKNEVVCYMGKKRLKDQLLTDILATNGGLKFDLRFLAI